MKALKHILTIFAALISLRSQMVAQPYYYYTDTAARCWRFNFQIGTRELFYSYTGVDTLYFGGGATWDPTQKWVFLYGNPGEHNEAYFSMDVFRASTPLAGAVTVLP